MEAASPARLYVTAVGALLVVLGIVGFFYSASFGSLGDVETALGVLRVNAWLNVAQIASGALALLLADYAPRPCALVLGLLYTALAIWGFAHGGGAILGFLPVNGGDDALHLVVGLLGLAATAGTPRQPVRSSKDRGPQEDHDPSSISSEPRAQAAGERS